MTRHITRLHLKSSAHCALCRTRLPDPFYDLDKQPPVNKAWEYEVLGFCNISPSKNPQIITIRADFKEPGTFSASLRIDGGSLLAEICLESECQQCQGGDIAYIIHIPCWKLISSRSRKPISAASIYQFAQSRHPLFDVGDALESEHDTLINIAHDTIAGLADTSLGHLLKRFLQLPPEIRSYISACCYSNLLSSLGTVSKISPWDLAKYSSGRNVIDFKHFTAPNSLRAVEISILGQQYIASVTLDRNNGISVRAADIQGIRFVIGRYGLRALGILYSNGSTSAWLGDPTNGWAGVIYSNDIREFYILRDDFKCLRIDLYNKESRLKTASRVIWDKLLDFTRAQYHQILDINTPSQIRNFPEWRLCKYLPFTDDSGSISGLTMYCNGHGVTGIVAHGQAQTQIGQRQGCPVHFFLQKDEYIVSVWVRVPARCIKVENEPSILVTTNLSRSCLFGPCLPQNIITRCQYAWSLLCQGSYVLGIFYDALAVRRCNRITNVGVTQDFKLQHQLPQATLPRIAFPDHRPLISQDTHTGIYFSNCKLDQIRSIQICQKGLRYTGMVIDHYNGRSDVLGQWDCQNSAISTLYNQNQGTLSKIFFRFSGRASNFYVDGVFLTVDNVDPPEIPLTTMSKLISFELPNTHDLAWWFSRDFDEIEIWQETNQEIRLSTERYDIIKLE